MSRARSRPFSGGLSPLALALAACAGVTGLDDYVIEDAVPPVTAPADAEASDTVPITPPADVTATDATVADATVVDSPIACADGEVATFDRCYFLVTTPRSQPAAKASCIEAGAHLVAITSEAENTTAAAIGTGMHRWIGLEAPPNPKNDAAAFRWVTNEPVTFAHWSQNIGSPAGPDPNQNHSCVALNEDASTSWYDRGCAELYAAICERP